MDDTWTSVNDAAEPARISIDELRSVLAAIEARKPAALLVDGPTYEQIMRHHRSSESPRLVYSGVPLHVCHSQEHAREYYDSLVRMGYEVHCHPPDLVTEATNPQPAARPQRGR